ncbi:MAG: hypothetical protein IH956_01730 [Chloroflexi bacterium]|nr:hypothetical protein [Chloroflexota bacterium]
MTQPVTGTSPGSALFPEYATLYDLIATEVDGLSDPELDFESDRWEWAAWSIRRQLSHMASLIYRWLIIRWGDTLFPEGDHGVEDVKGLAVSDYNRRMDEGRYWELPAVLQQLKGGIDLVQRVLAERSVGFLRTHTYVMGQSPQWELMIKAHPTGFTVTDDPAKEVMTLEATMRHIYFEETTHLYNIQRLKRAQGLATAVEVPRVGYWVVEGWDTSEP